MLEAAYAFAKQQIEADAGYLVAIAEALMERRALSHHDLIALQEMQGGPTVTDDLHARVKSALDRLSAPRMPKIQQLPVAMPDAVLPKMSSPEISDVHDGSDGGLEAMTREELLQEGARRLARHGIVLTALDVGEPTKVATLKTRFLNMFARPA